MRRTEAAQYLQHPQRPAVEQGHGSGTGADRDRRAEAADGDVLGIGGQGHPLDDPARGQIDGDQLVLALGRDERDRLTASAGGEGRTRKEERCDDSPETSHNISSDLP